MPSWKKVLISGSDAALNSLNVTTALTASGITYPSSDGTSGQVLVTNGSGQLSFSTISSGGTGASVKLSQTSAATTWSFAHHLNEKFPAVTIYDNNDEVIIPQKVDAIDNNNMLIYFSTPRTGTAAAVVGGSTVSASYSLYSDNAVTASYALTASYLEGYISPFPFTGSAIITGSLKVTGSVASTGGFTGSLQGTASNAISASYALTASYAPNLTISGSITSVNYIDFNTGSATPAWKSGRVFWDNADGCLAVYNAEADVTLQVGQENWTRVRNNTGTTITNGTLVRLDGAQGDTPTVERAQAIMVSGSVNLTNQILGVATHDIENSSFGYITTQGLVRGLNTNAFNEGDTLFVGTGSAGTLQNTAPAAPYEIIPVGVCVKASPGGSGVIYVAVQQPIDFSDLSSAKVEGTYSYGDLWTYQQSGSVGVWRHTNQLSGSYGLTGSLQATSFIGTLTGNASTATTASHALTASYLNPLYQNLDIHGNLHVYGTSSFTYVTSSQLDVDNSFISVNVFEPAERFGGIKIYDSGSSDATASLAWDSLHNHFVYQNASGSMYTGGMFLAGPRNTGSLGDEPNLTRWMVARSDGGDHLNDTQIYSSGSITQVTGSLTVTAGITGSLHGNADTATSASYATDATTAINANSGSNFVVTSTLRVDGSLMDYATVSSTSVGSNNIYTQATGSYTAAFCKYTILKGANARAGEFMTVWNGTSVTYTDTSTTDIGNTSDITLTSAVATGNIVISATAASTGWTIKTLVTYI